MLRDCPSSPAHRRQDVPQEIGLFFLFNLKISTKKKEPQIQGQPHKELLAPPKKSGSGAASKLRTGNRKFYDNFRHFVDTPIVNNAVDLSTTSRGKVPPLVIGTPFDDACFIVNLVLQNKKNQALPLMTH